MSIERARQINEQAVGPALALLPARMDSPAARVLLLAICGQEADFRHRWQVIDNARPEVRGPARGLWQFERGGGVAGVLEHASSRRHAAAVCAMQRVQPTAAAVYGALERDDVLAAAFARLLLWTDPKPLPPPADAEGGWQLYLRTWRPGAYTRGTAAARTRLRGKWVGYHATAREALGA